MPEEWRPAYGWEGLYEVSNLGRVRSLERVVAYIRRGKPCEAKRRSKVLRPRPTKQGYIMVALYRDLDRQDVAVHRLVAEAFHGPRPEGMAICHGNDIKTDNRPENLRFDTWSENQLDRVRNGIHPNANKTHCVNGHEFTPENTYVHRGRSRHCRSCARERVRQSRAKVA